MNIKHQFTPYIAGLCILASSSGNIALANSTAYSSSSALSTSIQNDTTISPYISGTSYIQGNRVSNIGKYFECTNTQKCTDPINEPGATWKYAWGKVSKKAAKQLDKSAIPDYNAGTDYSENDYVAIGKKIFQCKTLPNGEKCKSIAYQPKSKKVWKKSWKKLSSNQINSSSSGGGGTSSTSGGSSSSSSSGGTTTTDTPLEQAIKTGNALLVSDNKVFSKEILKTIRSQKKPEQNILKYVYNNDSISYDPGRSSQVLYLNSIIGSYILVKGNKNNLLAAASEINGQRNAAFADNAINDFTYDHNLAYEEHFNKVINWLLHQKNPNAANSATIKLVAFSRHNASRIKTWLANQNSQWDAVICDDSSNLEQCINNDTDLVITGSTTDIADDIVNKALINAQKNKISLLYNHTHTSFSNTELVHSILKLMNMSMKGNSGNYREQDSAQWSDYQKMWNTSSIMNSIETLISNLNNNSFTVDLSRCEDGCESNNEYMSQFLNGSKAIKNVFNALDKQKINIFKSDDYRLEKLLVLLSDSYRQTVQYPMDKTNTDVNEFLQSLYTDYSVYNFRTFIPVQPDMGNFSRSNFSHITPKNKTINLSSKKPFRSTGVYALPGQTFNVTRLDKNDLETSIFVNTLRSGATHQFQNNGYKRPKFLRTENFNIKSGETLSITSVYGGPIQIEFNEANIDTRFSFRNIGQHPYWKGTQDNNKFAEALEANQYDWAEFVTPGLEIHSTLEKMKQSITDSKWSGLSDFAHATMHYTHNFPLSLAAYKGPGIDEIPEVNSFASQHGLTLDEIDKVKHMNADQATCGGGCSGNPYDAYWAFKPVGHGDIHEIGHGLESGRFRFKDWDGHSSTNPYSYYTKSQYYKETGNNPECQSLLFSELHTTLQESLTKNDPFKFMQNANLTSWKQGITIYVQIMMAAQDQGALKDGWYLIPKLHLIERAFSRSRNNEEKWLATRDNIGFNQYTQSEAKNMSNNDFLSIAISFVTKRDYRNFLTMWGLGMSDKASEQVASFRFRKMPTRFYPSEPSDYCYGLDKPGVKIKL